MYLTSSFFGTKQKLLYTNIYDDFSTLTKYKQVEGEGVERMFEILRDGRIQDEEGGMRGGGDHKRGGIVQERTQVQGTGSRSHRGLCLIRKELSRLSFYDCV